MDYDKFRVRHVIGKYPKGGMTKEDLLFMICDWYYHRGGRSKMRNTRNVKDADGVTFTESDFLAYAGEDKRELLDSLVEEALQSGLIEVRKETKKNRIYELKIAV